MQRVIDAQRHELAHLRHRRAEARRAFHQRQLRGIERAQAGQAFGREGVCPDVGHHAGQGADASLGIEEAGLFLADGAVAEELHEGVSKKRKRFVIPAQAVSGHWKLRASAQPNAGALGSRLRGNDGGWFTIRPQTADSPVQQGPPLSVPYTSALCCPSSGDGIR